MMSGTDFQAMLPMMVVAAVSLGVLVVISFYRHHLVTLALTVGGFVAALLTIPFAIEAAPHRIAAIFIIDSYGLFYVGLVLVAASVIALFSYDYLERQEVRRDEYYLLLILSTLGAMVLVTADNFITFFLGIELLTISLYVLIVYTFTHEQVVEAGIKYLILGGATTAFLLFGMALVYADLGTVEMSAIAALLAAKQGGRDVFLLAGIALMTTGIGFKLSFVPFHSWTPDVYQGAPAPVTAYLATISKGAIVAILLRFFIEADLYAHTSMFVAFSALAMASMLVGNTLAVLQTNVKRILAYSSISHFGSQPSHSGELRK